VTVNLGPGTVTWGEPNFTPATLVLNETTANNALTFLTDIDLNNSGSSVTRRIAVNANTATITGVLSKSSGIATLRKTGQGTLVLSGTNTFTDGLWIDAGTLIADSPAALGTGPITLNGGSLQATKGLSLPASQGISGYGAVYGDILADGNLVGSGSGLAIHGSLCGNLTATGKLAVYGTLSPGHGCGAMHVSTLDLKNADLRMEIGGLVPETEYDRVLASGALTLGQDLDVIFTGGFTPSADQSFDLLDWGTLAGQFANLNLPNLPPGLQWDTSVLYGTGTIRVAEVPEPTSVLLLAVAGVTLARRRPGLRPRAKTTH
jgi:autotransporter-associated beta strand protein